MTPPADAQSLLEDLLMDPPADEVEARARLAGLDVQPLHEALVDLLEGDDPSAEERSLASLVLSLDGPGAQRDRLISLALDTARPRLARATALIVLADTAPEVFARLAPEDVTLPVEAAIEELLNHVPEHAEAAKELAELFATAPSTARPFLVQTLLRMSEAQGLPVEPLIEPLLKKKALAAHKASLVEALAQDAGARGAELLEAMAKKGSKADTAPLAEAARRIRTRLAKASIPEGTQAWALPCDGSGTFQILMATAGEQRTLAGVLGHVTDGLIDGLFFTELAPEELDEILAGVMGQEQMPVAVLPVATAAAMLGDFARRSATRPWGSEMALAAIGQFETEAFVAPQPASEIDRAQVETLLLQPQFRSWLIEPALLPALPPEEGPQRDAWLNEMLTAFDEDARGALASMARYDAWWLDAQGDASAAGQLAAAAVELMEAPERSVLLRFILDATARAIYELEVDEDDEEASSEPSVD